MPLQYSAAPVTPPIRYEARQYRALTQSGPKLSTVQRYGSDLPTRKHHSQYFVHEKYCKMILLF